MLFALQRLTISARRDAGLEEFAALTHASLPTSDVNNTWAEQVCIRLLVLCHIKLPPQTFRVLLPSGSVGVFTVAAVVLVQAPAGNGTRASQTFYTMVRMHRVNAHNEMTCV
jgi:hypothetical protein